MIAEPVHNVVLRDVLVPAGSTFIAKRARAKVEFLASKDSWFRPVNMYIGPDGAIYLTDFYRPVLEHPEWVPNYSSHSKMRIGETTVAAFTGSFRTLVYRSPRRSG